MLILFLSGVFLSVSLLAWLGQRWLSARFIRYRQRFQQQARKGLAEMFLFPDPTQLWIASLALGLALIVLAWMLADSLVPASLGAMALCFAPRLVLRRAQLRRLRRIDQQMPDLLLALAGALRAGVGLQAALRHAAEHTPAPLAQELGLMLRQQRMGVAFEDALQGLQLRIPTEGARLMVSALSIASKTGGQLAETLERVASTLRSRLHAEGRIRALTAQGRMQAWIMACLPAGLAGVLHWLDPQSMAALWTTPAGWGVLVLIGLLELLGLFFIRKIVNITV